MIFLNWLYNNGLFCNFTMNELNGLFVNCLTNLVVVKYRQQT